MGINKGLLLFVLTIISATGVLADTIPPAVDPRIKVGHGTGSTGVGLSFDVKVVGGGGITDFFNNTSFTWVGLDFTGISKVPQAVQCFTDSTLFNNCVVEPTIPINGKKFQVTVSYFNGEILPGEHFFVDLRSDTQHLMAVPVSVGASVCSFSPRTRY